MKKLLLLSGIILGTGVYAGAQAVNQRAALRKTFLQVADATDTFLNTLEKEIRTHPHHLGALRIFFRLPSVLDSFIRGETISDHSLLDDYAQARTYIDELKVLSEQQVDPRAFWKEVHNQFMDARRLYFTLSELQDMTKKLEK